MKKTLLNTSATLFLFSSVFSQTLSPSWMTVQNTNFTVTSASINNMDAVDQNVLWATGLDNLAINRNYNWFTTTNNGGTSFTSGNVFSDTNTYILGNIEGIDANNAWVAAYYKATGDRGVVYHTTNGGSTWTNGGAANMYSVTGTSFIDFVCFITPSIGLTVGDPVAGEFEIYRTTNAGTTWAAVAGSAIPNPLTNEYGCEGSFAKFGANNIWFGTSKCRIYRSVDAGQTWSVSAALTSTLGASVQLTDIAFSDANNGLAKAYFGSAFYSGLTLWKTSDGGITWSQIPYNSNFGRYSLCSVPGTSLYASCEGVPFTTDALSFSPDAGVTWNSWGGSGIPYYAIDFVSNTVGWVGSVSSATAVGQGGIYKFSGAALSITNTNYTPYVVNLYPNPNNGIINLNLQQAKEETQIYITDALGNIVYTENLKSVSSGNHVLNLQHLTQGIYNITISTGNERLSQKIIIQ